MLILYKLDYANIIHIMYYIDKLTGNHKTYPKA